MKEDPVRPEDLNSGEQYSNEYDASTMIELGFTGFGITSETTVEHKTSYLVYEYTRYKNVVETQPGAPKAGAVFGCSVRCVIKATSTSVDTSNSYKGLFDLTAKAVTGEFQTEATIEGIGCKPGPLLAAIPKFTTLDGSAYVDLMHAFTTAIPNLMCKPENLAPTLLGLVGNERKIEVNTALLKEAVASSYALTEIGYKWPLAESGYYNESEDPEFKRLARAIYRKFTNFDTIAQKPGSEIAKRARDILNGLEMEKAD